MVSPAGRPSCFLKCGERREEGGHGSQVFHPEDPLMFEPILLAKDLHFVWPSWLPLLQFWLVFLLRLLLPPFRLPLRRRFLLFHY
jgi:hypothetical protein